jgi:hypothetical protein
LKEAKPWFDTQNNSLVYVFDAGGTTGKVAIRVNYVSKVIGGGKRHSAKGNFIRTGGAIDASHIKEPEYKPLS